MGETVDVHAEVPHEADDYALIWGGTEQHPGGRPASEKFAGPLADAKRPFADTLCEQRWYLTAEYGFAYPDDRIRDDDTTFEEVDLAQWLTHTSMAMGHFCVLEEACLWVLVDDAILHRETDEGMTLKGKLDSLPYWVRYPFTGKDDDQKLAWLEDNLDVGFPLDRGVPLVGHS